MSASTPCTCGSRSGWVVAAYKCNHSAFNGYRRTTSDWSAVICEHCTGAWRTKAKYIESLPRMDRDNRWPGL